MKELCIGECFNLQDLPLNPKTPVPLRSGPCGAYYYLLKNPLNKIYMFLLII